MRHSLQSKPQSLELERKTLLYWWDPKLVSRCEVYARATARERGREWCAVYLRAKVKERERCDVQCQSKIEKASARVCSIRMCAVFTKQERESKGESKSKSKIGI